MGGCEIICGDLGRTAVFVLCAGGVVCSYFVATSCEFFSFSTRDPSILPPPFDNVTSGHVGLFYHYDYPDNPDVCDQLYYDSWFVVGKDGNPFNIFFQIAQLAAVIGPACAGVAFLLNVMEWCCCQLSVSFFISFFLLFLAFAGQGMSFMIYGQREFCFDDFATEDCSLERGAYLSIAAAGAFYVASVIWCCMPRPKPVLQRPKQDAAKKDNDDEPPPTPVTEAIDRDLATTTSPNGVDGSRSWQDYEKPSFEENTGEENGYYDAEAPVESSNHFQGDSMGGSQQQQSLPLYEKPEPSAPTREQLEPRGSYDPAQYEEQEAPAVSQDDFENPFQEIADSPH